MSNTENGERIVTEKGQATIPKSLWAKHGISAPGRVKFVESEDGEIVVRPVGTMREFRRLERSDDEDRSATETLRQERERDERESDELVDRLAAGTDEDEVPEEEGLEDDEATDE
ncbi:AbrB/MazE/SpoVT family DNA-binding domain-containing protein [Natronoarchaeum mannanilyticum]|uniref:AbrB/MazE/SpoVT family DNA-binding domain-containing protein n=1 Tax=Natronoarchaeum mannanilyticum TaxID=926360 RepID=A0AAV3TC35_9EURY